MTTFDNNATGSYNSARPYQLQSTKPSPERTLTMPGRKPLEIERWEMQSKGFVTVRQAALRIGIARAVVNRWIAEGFLSAETVRGFRYVALSDIARLRQQAQEAGREVPTLADDDNGACIPS